MDFLTAIDISASGLAVQRERMNVASSNVANAQSTRSEDGGPYRRRDVIVGSLPALEGDSVHGAEVREIVADSEAPRLEYDPGHPDANADGYVAYPNVSVIEEMVDMITASRAYEAGVTSLDAAVSMAERAMSIGR